MGGKQPFPLALASGNGVTATGAGGEIVIPDTQSGEKAKFLYLTTGAADCWVHIGESPLGLPSTSDFTFHLRLADGVVIDVSGVGYIRASHTTYISALENDGGTG
jgi:hypothetical protein